MKKFLTILLALALVCGGAVWAADIPFQFMQNGMVFMPKQGGTEKDPHFLQRKKRGPFPIWIKIKGCELWVPGDRRCVPTGNLQRCQTNWPN